MTQLCLIFAGFGLGLSLLLYVATKCQWSIAPALMRSAPWIVTLAAAGLLLMFLMLAAAGTNDLADAMGKGLKQAEYTLRDWFSSLRFRSSG